MVDAGAAQVHGLWLDLCEGQDVTRLSQGKFNAVLQVLGCQVSPEEQQRLFRSVPSFAQEAVDEQIFGGMIGMFQSYGSQISRNGAGTPS